MSDLRGIHDAIIDNPDFNLTVRAKRNLRQLIAENERLEAEWRIQNECIADQHDTIRRLREALEKYADRENWQISVGEAIFSADGYEGKPWRLAEEALKD